MPDSSSAGQRRRHLFLPIGSVWFGVLALALQLVALSSSFQGWGTVEILGPSVIGENPPTLWPAPRFELRIIKPTEHGEYSETSIGTAHTILLPGSLAAGLGLLLATASLFVPGRTWRLIGWGVALNILHFILLVAMRHMQ